MIVSHRTKRHLLKLLGLFSVVRGYNILTICVAQYLAAVFVFSKNESFKEVFFNDVLFMLVVAGAFAVAGGYIINSFYDYEKDLINNPFKSMIDRLISQNTKLTAYFLLNFFSIFVAGYVSFRAILFFSAYIFGMWIYSHRLKKIPFVGNVTAALLAITPFFAIFLYYKNFDLIIFVHAFLVFLLILIKDLTKDLRSLKGDLAQNYQTIAVKYGEKVSKIAISIAVLMCFIPIYALLTHFDVGNMKYYLAFTCVFLCFYIFFLWISNKQKQYTLLHNLLKITLISGVFSISLIDTWWIEEICR
ncbi:geranylgeranylglycerol-phosphate geranylgeranyltransferase [Capnocytophaga canimorsus]|uniref:geranylgeranylglycerol-phosphate geranylgeranyltransferase n=1 Tax=Capnocytophaga canimorsus TaxID=28188 RepID=UPI0028E9FD16|nr:geranylgeranylglycerol-phosphate geranylgeranyltransferase [Capnocytophaga canimorsus]MDT9499478.1 geranylgeranylglycerol-phosphate geranylgeranyltransferase [Capnocytophaga canimorsus]